MAPWTDAGPGARGTVRLPASPSADGAPVTLHYREWGAGTPVLVLHGGWGYGAYPFDAQALALAARGFRVLAPDRTGYGGSTPVDALALDFHARAAAESHAFLDALGIEKAHLWGHSDGAVIAAHMALAAPDRHPAVILEALHYWRVKPRSRKFFETCATDPDAFGSRLAAVLEADHGARSRDVVRMNGRAWLRLADESPARDADLYGGRLGDVHSRVLVLHGARDPRTEPGELDAVFAALPHAERAVLPDGGHSPHSERATAADATARALAFLTRA